MESVKIKKISYGFTLDNLKQKNHTFDFYTFNFYTIDYTKCQSTSTPP